MKYRAIRSRGDVRSSFAAGAGFTVYTPDRPSCRREAVVCPKPRRFGVLNGIINGPSTPLRHHWSDQVELSDSQAGSELLDIILSKGGGGFERNDTNSNKNTQVGLSSPFFCGSPPSRVSNPLTQDALFKEEKLLPCITPSCTHESSPASTPTRKGVSARGNFGNKPAIRIEGFDCLDRDRSRNCSIPASA